MIFEMRVLRKKVDVQNYFPDTDTFVASAAMVQRSVGFDVLCKKKLF